LADVLFSDEQAGKPAYALPNADDANAVWKRFGSPGDDGEGWLRWALRVTLEDHTSVDPLKRYREAAVAHRVDPMRTPSWLPLLAALAMGAEGMRASQGAASHNYYTRLFEVLDTPPSAQKHWQDSYRISAEILWAGLNSWLEAWEGLRGVPTAYALGAHKYVGLAMSQALVRERDRERLPGFFHAEGLPPGYRVGSAEMEAMLDPWMSRQPPYFSHPMRALWGTALAREGIATTSCLELEAWDGSGVDVEDSATRHLGQRARLLAQVRTFPLMAITLDLLLPGAGGERSTVLVETADAPVSVRTTVAPAASRRLADPTQVDPASLLSDQLEIRNDVDAPPMIRQPRRIVSLRWDEKQNAYVEAERVQLGEQTLLLVADHVAFKVDQILHAAARPGFRKLEPGSAGLPDGWAAFIDVQFLGRFPDTITKHNDFLALLPRAATALTMSGGFVLPGLIRKWSSLAPPEIHAVAAAAQGLRVDVYRGTVAGTLVHTATAEGSVAVIPLQELDLNDGEYLVTLTVEDERHPSATSLLRLRSSDTPTADLTRNGSSLVYRPSVGPLWPLSADVPDSGPQIDGVVVTLQPTNDDLPLPPMPEARQRVRQQVSTAQRPVLRVGRGLGAASCLNTGNHYFLVPTAYGGHPATSTVPSQCRTCGMVKRFPTTPAGAKKKAKTVVPVKPLDLSRVPPVSDGDPQNLSVAFDSMCHLGGGSLAHLQRVAGQVDGSALFADVLTRRLEALGHVDFRRDPRTLAVIDWELTPPTLTQVGTDVWWLAGRQPKSMVKALSDLVTQFGGVVSAELDQGIPRLEVTATRADLDAIIDKLVGTHGRIGTVENNALALARSLPHLSTVTAGLHRVSAIVSDSVQRWDTDGASWVSSRSIEAKGGYRFQGYVARYFVRDDDDLKRGTIALANPYLTKHLANLWSGDPLAGYHGQSASVVVPLGADLPGLYGRALCLATGRLPRELTGARMLQYRSVPASVANLIHDRLSA